MVLTGKRIDRENGLPAQVASKVVAEVMAGRLKPGDQLPTEPELSDLYGVSRTVIREAMVRLKSDGVVRSKQGSGVFILDSSESPVLRLDRASLMDRETVRNLFELRAIIESGAAWLAAERRDPTALDEIAAALEELRSLSGAEAASVDSDLAFHQAVAHATARPATR
jgi:GntR family transcriptional regulator, transcriptional repressor for pyruvate dehydrogenase complex